MRKELIAKTLLFITSAWTLVGFVGCASHRSSVDFGNLPRHSEAAALARNQAELPSATSQPTAAPQPALTSYPRAELASWRKNSSWGNFGGGNSTRSSNCFT
jgi:hypothetical protein